MLETPRLCLLLIAVVGLVQGMFLLLLLYQQGKRAFCANRWLFVFIIAVCLSFVEDLADVLLEPSITLYLIPVFLTATFVLMPAIFLYFREIAGHSARRPLLHFAIILPVFVSLVVSVFLILQNFQDLIVGEGEIELELEDHFVLGMIPLTVIFALYLQVVIYMVRTWRVTYRYLRQAREQLGADEKALRRWVRELLIGISVIFVIFAATTILEIFTTESDWSVVFVQAGFVLVFLRLCHLIAANPALFVQAEWDGVQEIEMDNSTGVFFPTGTKQTRFAPRNLVDADEISRICKRLDDIKAKSDLLFDPLVSLPKLAIAVGATPNQLSFVLNQHLCKSFFDFINEARTDEASRLLVNEPDRTILDIATSVGFNSKSTFNLAFKKITGKTPSVYRSETMSQRNTAP
ncbi:helix-turn-helix domain-containing protein [Thalassospira sp. A3_1]|uniref:AraC family transcriptional regulator n=1 Tax=Thalassospira sp. A3_1 TaxID=2821088 RepID=UPI001AD9F6BE|nr:helix-turn-helix domain-containing protein [Thalassospira sp. A3_1]MBO9505909.1 AraC family transcriptional regulator [Thalassospira sp. A3_1]